MKSFKNHILKEVPGYFDNFFIDPEGKRLDVPTGKTHELFAADQLGAENTADGFDKWLTTNPYIRCAVSLVGRSPFGGFSFNPDVENNVSNLIHFLQSEPDMRHLSMYLFDLVKGMTPDLTTHDTEEDLNSAVRYLKSL